ncbi:hypothetical protein SOVF_074610, partial [Spinacia oleracea]
LSLRFARRRWFSPVVVVSLAHRRWYSSKGLFPRLLTSSPVVPCSKNHRRNYSLLEKPAVKSFSARKTKLLCSAGSRTLFSVNPRRVGGQLKLEGAK